MVRSCSRSATATSGKRPTADTGDLVLGVLGEPVVTEIPDDRLEVAEHAEVVRHALGVRRPIHRAGVARSLQGRV